MRAATTNQKSKTPPRSIPRSIEMGSDRSIECQGMKSPWINRMHTNCAEISLLRASGNVHRQALASSLTDPHKREGIHIRSTHCRHAPPLDNHISGHPAQNNANGAINSPPPRLNAAAAIGAPPCDRGFQRCQVRTLKIGCTTVKKSIRS